MFKPRDSHMAAILRFKECADRYYRCGIMRQGDEIMMKHGKHDDRKMMERCPSGEASITD